jgi:hypothetical protein
MKNELKVEDKGKGAGEREIWWMRVGRCTNESCEKNCPLIYRRQTQKLSLPVSLSLSLSLSLYLSLSFLKYKTAVAK